MSYVHRKLRQAQDSLRFRICRLDIQLLKSSCLHAHCLNRLLQFWELSTSRPTRAHCSPNIPAGILPGNAGTGIGIGMETGMPSWSANSCLWLSKWLARSCRSVSCLSKSSRSRSEMARSSSFISMRSFLSLCTMFCLRGRTNSSPCVSLQCSSILLRRRKHCPHTGHAWGGFSPVWIRRWHFMFHASTQKMGILQRLSRICHCYPN